jgi:hypothetical protein
VREWRQGDFVTFDWCWRRRFDGWFSARLSFWKILEAFNRAFL